MTHITSSVNIYKRRLSSHYDRSVKEETPGRSLKNSGVQFCLTKKDFWITSFRKVQKAPKCKPGTERTYRGEIGTSIIDIN